MFLKKIKNSFKMAKNDISCLRASMNDWIMYLNGNQNDMKVKLRELDQRLRKLEYKYELEVLR